MIKRIKSLISVKNLSPSQFADQLGVQRSSISHILSGRNKPSLDFVLKIVEVYPGVSLNWLLKGEGEMFEQAHKRLEPEMEFALETNKDESEANEVRGEGEEPGDLQVKEQKEENVQSVEVVKEEKQEPLPIKQRDFEEKTEGKDEPEKIVMFYPDGSFRVYRNEK